MFGSISRLHVLRGYEGKQFPHFCFILKLTRGQRDPSSGYDSDPSLDAPYTYRHQLCRGLGGKASEYGKVAQHGAPFSLSYGIGVKQRFS